MYTMLCLKCELKTACIIAEQFTVKSKSGNGLHNHVLEQCV